MHFIFAKADLTKKKTGYLTLTLMKHSQKKKNALTKMCYNLPASEEILSQVEKKIHFSFIL